MSQLNSIYDGVKYADLIGGTAVSPIIHNATYTSTGTDTVPAGTVLNLADDVVVAASANGNAILAKDVTPSAASEEIVVPVFVRGVFNREKLTGLEGNEDALRAAGIYLTTLKG